MRVPRRVTALTFAILLLAFLISAVAEQGQPRRTGTRPQRPTAAEQKPTPRAQQSSSIEPTPPKPSAEWLVAVPNPLNVVANLSQQSSASKIIRGDRGGTISAKGPDGTSFTLSIPKGAVPGDMKVTITPVASIGNLPFADGLVAAVQIAPEDLPLAVMPTLVIKPAVPIPAAEQISFASFGYHENGKEFHLYPLEADPAHITFRLVRFGGFGIARSTESEREAVHLRQPTDSADRMLMQIEKLKRVLRERRLRQAPAQSSASRESWTLVNASWREPRAPQTASGVNPAEFYRTLVNNLREQYQQEVMPKLKAVKLECRSNMLIRLFEALNTAYYWMHNVEVLGLRHELTVEELTQEEKDEIIRGRLSKEGLTGAEWRQRFDWYQSHLSITPAELEEVERERMKQAGYSPEEIPQLQKEMKAVQVEFDQMFEALDNLIVDKLKAAYQKAHQCCVQEAKDFYLSMMDRLTRYLILRSLEDSTSVGKRDECACAIKSVSAGQSGTWLGEITHTESYDDEGSRTSGSSRTITWHRKLYYEATLTTQYSYRISPDSGGIPAYIDVTGDAIRAGGTTETRGQCSWGRKNHFKYDGSLSDETNLAVTISSDGKTYRVNYTVPCVDGSGDFLDHIFTEGASCNPFEIKNRNSKRLTPKREPICPTQTGVLLKDGRYVGIQGQLDPKNPKLLAGSDTFTEPLEENPSVNRTITITWRLTRCR